MEVHALLHLPGTERCVLGKGRYMAFGHSFPRYFNLQEDLGVIWEK